MCLETPNFFATWLNLSPGPTDQWDEPGRTPMNNSSFFTADRSTHLKIVVVSLLASILVIAIGVAARPVVSDGSVATVYKPPKAIMATTAEGQAIR